MSFDNNSNLPSAAIARVGMKSIYRLSDAQPNWDQEDPSQPDYIKNKDEAEQLRPVYVDGVLVLNESRDSGPLNFISGDNVLLTLKSGAIVVSANPGGTYGNVVGGDGIDITDGASGQKIVSLKKDFIVSEYVKSISSEKIIHTDGRTLPEIIYEIENVAEQALADAAVAQAAIGDYADAHKEDYSNTTIDDLLSTAIANLSIQDYIKTEDALAAIDTAVAPLTQTTQELVITTQNLTTLTQQHESKLAGVETSVSDLVNNAISTQTYPTASADTAGVVKLSETVGTDENGALQVKSLSTDTLVQGEMILVLESY